MLPDRVSNPGPLTYESGVLPIAPRGPALFRPDTGFVVLCKHLAASELGLHCLPEEFFYRNCSKNQNIQQKALKVGMGSSKQ